MFRFMFRWSLEITGASILLFNYQSYQRQQQMIGMYKAARNSARTIYTVAGLMKDFKQLANASVDTPQYSQQAEQFRHKSAQTFQKLCEANQGVYARMGQIMSKMTGILPSYVLNSFQKLNNLTPSEIPYQTIKQAITQSLQKPMKELFDGFQTKPFKTTLFWQEHKSILLQNYKESLVKVMPHSALCQSQWDFWFINKCLDYLNEYVQKKKPQVHDKYKQVERIIKEAEDMTKNQLSFKKQYESAQQLGNLIYQMGSSFYIPYYYQKYATDSVIIRQFVEGVPLSDVKGLKQLGLSTEIAFAQTMSQLHRMMNKYGLISGGLEPGSILIRKYIKPAKRKTDETAVNENVAGRKKNVIAKGRELIQPQYQIVFLDLNNLQSLPQKTTDSIHNYWHFLKKTKKTQQPPSVSSFDSYVNNLNNIKDNLKDSLKSNAEKLLQEKYYLYEPMLKFYQQYVGKKVQ